MQSNEQNGSLSGALPPLAVVGGGNMAHAILSGAQDAGVLDLDREDHKIYLTIGYAVICLILAESTNQIGCTYMPTLCQEYTIVDMSVLLIQTLPTCGINGF